LDPSTLLSQLRDIHAPDPISIWPLAIGWWLLIILTTVVFASLCYFIAKKRAKTTWKRQAYKTFNELSAAYLKEPSDEHLLQLSRLLKQAFSSAKNNRDYLHLCESDWEDALKSVRQKDKSILHEQEIHILSKDIYARATGKLDDAALKRISLWIKHLG
tara:strand:+ start:71879 stop:72355 length:477 start_codon:yes stop_codon:yes gene_type:complete